MQVTWECALWKERALWEGRLQVLVAHLPEEPRGWLGSLWEESAQPSCSRGVAEGESLGSLPQAPCFAPCCSPETNPSGSELECSAILGSAGHRVG